MILLFCFLCVQYIRVCVRWRDRWGWTEGAEDHARNLGAPHRTPRSTLVTSQKQKEHASLLRLHQERVWKNTLYHSLSLFFFFWTKIVLIIGASQSFHLPSLSLLWPLTSRWTRWGSPLASGRCHGRAMWQRCDQTNSPFSSCATVALRWPVSSSFQTGPPHSGGGRCCGENFK